MFIECLMKEQMKNKKAFIKTHLVEENCQTMQSYVGSSNSKL